MKKLKDLLNTRYVYNSYLTKLDQVLREIAENERELDLAECNFTPQAVGVIRHYYGKIYFVNSADARLNQLLLANNGCLTAKMDNPQLLKFDFKNVEEFKQLLMSLDKTGNYVLAPGRDITIIATATIIIMMYPNLMLDVDNRIGEIFKFARNEWLKCNEHHDAYWLVDNTGLVKLPVDENGYVKLIDKRLVKESVLVKLYNVMPIDFGTRVIIKDDEFRPIFQNALRVLDTKHEPERRMLDFLERRGLNE